MRILNWNTEFVGPRARSDKFKQICALIANCAADVVCLTEAYPEAIPAGWHVVRSEVSGRVKPESGGARKVVLGSRFGWTDIDTLGSDRLPEGRFVSAKTRDESGQEWTFIGICIPYFGYRMNRRFWGDNALRPWQGAETFLDAFRSDVLPLVSRAQQTILLGDYNLHIPPGKTSRQTNSVTQKCEQTFNGWQIPTAGEISDPALDKRFIDHVALSQDIELISLRFISRFSDDGAALSDHNGVCIDVAAV
ncbi:MAG: hypothetical protein OXG68_04405 [Chloroflexi bacterium]|nr:hypothetical protein [Chloroflexota bacterium]